MKAARRTNESVKRIARSNVAIRLLSKKRPMIIAVEIASEPNAPFKGSFILQERDQKFSCSSAVFLRCEAGSSSIGVMDQR